MGLIDYIADAVRRDKLASDTAADPQWLWQIATCWRGKQASPKLALRIESATQGAVTRHDLRPDIWPPERAKKRECGKDKRAA